MIFFASDFGHADGWVGIVEGVVATHAPSVRVVHLAHDIAPQDVRAASYVLWAAAPHLPDGAIVLAVVDPGVGSDRRAIAARSGRLAWVGPDNGLFAAAWRRDPPSEAVALVRDPGLRARTFDGRDVFAPAAARLASGSALVRLGTPVEPRSLVDASCVPTRDPIGEIWTFDRYGNAITTLEADFGVTGSVVCGPHELSLGTHFASVPVGHPVAYVGSSGLVEIAIRDGSARSALGLAVGDRVSRSG